MAVFAPLRRIVAAGLLCLALAWPGPSQAAKPAKSPAVAPPVAVVAPEAGVVEVCGALLVEPGLAEPWPGAKAVRPGETILPTDKGLGCRFTLPGQAGEPVLVAARLTRPSVQGGEPVVDRWYVSARRNVPASATYAFFPPGQVTPGTWRLELFAGDTLFGAATFVAPSPTGETGPDGKEASALAAPAAASADAGTAQPPTSPVTPAEAPALAVASGPAPAVTADSAPTPAVGAAGVRATVGVAAPAQPPAGSEPPRRSPDVAQQTGTMTATPVPLGANAAIPAPAAQAVKASTAASAQAPAPGPSLAQSAASPPQVVASTKVAAGPTAKAKSAAAPTQESVPAKLPAKGFIALQTGLFADAQNAASQAALLRAKGIPACVAEEKPGGKARHRVLAGHFGDKRAALAGRGEVRAAVGVAPLVYAVEPAQAAGLRCH